MNEATAPDLVYFYPIGKLVGRYGGSDSFGSGPVNHSHGKGLEGAKCSPRI